MPTAFSLKRAIRPAVRPVLNSSVSFPGPSVPAVASLYLQPDGVSLYRQPDGTSRYLRP